MRKLILIMVIVAAAASCTKDETPVRDKGVHGGLMTEKDKPKNECKQCVCNPAYCPVGTAD